MSQTGELVKISLNGKANEIKTGMTVSDLLLKWKVRPELVTVEVNESILQKLDYDTTELKNGDKVEFVFYMGGGASLVSMSPASGSAGSTNSGFELNGFFGCEFFLPGLDSLGINFQAGIGVTSLSSGVRFRTIGDTPLTAGVYFYF